MSATYRIEIRRDVHSKVLPWDALIYRVSDDKQVAVVHAQTSFAVLTEARKWIKEEEDGDMFEGLEGTYWTDDQGRDVEAPQSVKV